MQLIVFPICVYISIYIVTSPSKYNKVLRHKTYELFKRGIVSFDRCKYRKPPFFTYTKYGIECIMGNFSTHNLIIKKYIYKVHKVNNKI